MHVTASDRIIVKMLLNLAVTFLCVFVPRFAESASINSVDSLDEQLLLQWSNAAMQFFDFHRCIQVSLADEGECYKLSQIRRSQIAVYVGRAKMDMESMAESNNMYEYQFVGMKGGAPPGGRQKVYAILPDSSNQKESKAHDVILALDPYPNANFGHLVGLFYVDFGVEDRFCKENHQSLTPDQTCITVARKSRCPNLLDRHSTSFQPRRCHIDFLPTVHLAGYSSHGALMSIAGQEMTLPSTDLLECLKIPGFGNCPKLRPIQETSHVLCDAAHVNSKRCDTSYMGVGTRCKLFQTCDRAVLVGGGWNRQHSGTQSLLNIFKLDDMLQRNGFQTDNIKIFYANGGQPVGTNVESGEGRQMLSSVMKIGLRGHLRTICESRHCADTLFIYLNNPTTVEGDILLWDVDADGMANELEKYTVKELLTDLAGCEAKRVILLVDQSNSDILVNSIRDSSVHQNIAVFASGAAGQVTENGEITGIWANHSHPTYCLQHLQDVCKQKMTTSTPIMYDNTPGTALKFSAIGAPCDLNPPLTQRELRSLYQGCQNVPTSVWFSLLYAGRGTDAAEEDEGDGSDIESEENASNNRRVS